MPIFNVMHRLDHGDERDQPAEDGEGRGGRAHARHQGPRVYHRGHRTGLSIRIFVFPVDFPMKKKMNITRDKK